MHVCMNVQCTQVHTCVFTQNSPSLHQGVPDYYAKPKGMPSLPSSWEGKKGLSRLSFASPIPS